MLHYLIYFLLDINFDKFTIKFYIYIYIYTFYALKNFKMMKS